MKKDVLIINTARGGIIDEDNLYEVMKSGHIGGVAIDVFDQEPYEGSLMDILHPWPYYIIEMTVLALALFFILSVPFLRRSQSKD